MTLNASGPLSLGGATAGQSINLELGQSATALASINATNFRALAGVASGQISISNFYGKSSSTSYILFMGNSAPANDSSIALGYGYAVNNLGVSVFKMGGNTKFTWVSAAGASITTKFYGGSGALGAAATICAFDNKLPSGTDYVAATIQNAYANVYSSSNSYSQSIVGNCYPGNVPYEIFSASGSPDGQIAFAGINDQGKSGWAPVMVRVNPATGASVIGRRALSNYIGGTSAFAKLLYRTNGTYIYVVCNGSTTIMNILDNNLNYTSTGGSEVNHSGSLCIGAVLSTSNELFLWVTDGRLYTITEGAETSQLYRFSAISAAYSSAAVYAFGMDVYNNTIYIASNCGSGLTNGRSLTICAVNPSTRAVLWTKRFVLSGTSNYLNPIVRNNMGNCIQARPTGLYVAFMAWTSLSGSGTGPIYQLCIPLDGNVADQTVTINSATGQTMTISTPSNTTSTLNQFTVTPRSNVNTNDSGAFKQAAYTSIAGDTITIAKTSF